MRKHPVSIALSNGTLRKIDQEAAKQKRSRSEYIEYILKKSSPTNHKAIIQLRIP